MSLQLLTPSQAVEFFHDRGLKDINEKWIKNRCDSGDLPYTLVSRRRRIRTDVLQRMFDGWVKDAQ